MALLFDPYVAQAQITVEAYLSAIEPSDCTACDVSRLQTSDSSYGSEISEPCDSEYTKMRMSTTKQIKFALFDVTVKRAAGQAELSGNFFAQI